MEAKNLAVMFTDMRGFTAETSKRSRESINKLLEAHENLTRNVVTSHGGKIIKNLGDGYLIVFESPTNALLAAEELQKRVVQDNEGLSGKEKFQLKVAIASGDVIVKNDDVFGEPVNTSARVLAGVQPGEIYLTQSVYLAMNKNELKISEIGERSYKGIPHKVRIYKVEGKKGYLAGIADPIKKVFGQKKMSRNFKVAIASVAFFLIASGVYAAINQKNTTSNGEPDIVGAYDSFSGNSGEGGSSESNPDSTSTEGGNSQGNGGSKVQGTQSGSSGSQGGGNGNTGNGQGNGNSGGTPRPTNTPRINTPKPSNTPKPTSTVTATPVPTATPTPHVPPGQDKDKEKNNSGTTGGPPPQQP